MTTEISLDEFDRLERRISDLTEPMGIPQMAREISLLEEEVSKPGVWEERQAAEKLLSELAAKRRFLVEIETLQCGISDLRELFQIAQDANDFAELTEVAKETHSIGLRLDKLHETRLLSGEYDRRSAVMSIRSGAGGDDATDFAEMLMRMYLRYAELVNLKATVLEATPAEGAGIKSASVLFDGPFAYGKLSVETGTHRLVRISPFNSAGKRQTSFAAVQVIPLIDSTDEVDIPEGDIRVDVFRSSGPGGQSVNTTNSAVRLTHLPTGIVVSCQNQKSQLQNKVEAMKVLQSRLLDARRMEDETKKKQLAGNVKASWGEQIRSYVLAPYKLVRDLRTDYEENNPEVVFSGKLEGFISAGVKWRAKQNS